MTFHYRYRKQIILGCIIICIIGLGIGFYFYNRKPIKKNKKEEVVLVEKDTLKKEKEITLYKVDIKGQINNPGIYTMEKDSRVVDQTTPNMIQRISGIFERNPLISKEI